MQDTNVDKKDSDMREFDLVDIFEQLAGWGLGFFVEGLGLGLFWVACWTFCIPLMLVMFSVTGIPLSINGPPEGFNPWPAAIVVWTSSLIALIQIPTIYSLINYKRVEQLRKSETETEKNTSLAFVKQTRERLVVRNILVRSACFLWWGFGWIATMILLSFLIFVWDTSDPKIHDWLMILMKLLMSAQLGFGGNTMFVMAIACVNPSMVSLRKAWLVICVLDGAILWLLGQRIATIWIGGFP